jgi:hypothetical protein
VRFADVSIQLLPPAVSVMIGGYDAAEVHEWQAEVGFFTEWTPPWSVVLGQVGFMDRFTVTLSRHAQGLAVSDFDDFDQRYPQSPNLGPANDRRFMP